MPEKSKILTALLLASAILNSGCSLTAPPREQAVLWGQADATEVDVNTKVPGRLVEVYVKEGSLVRKGDRLAQIDAREQNTLYAAAKAKVEAAKAACIQAQANLEQAQRDINRYEELYQRGAVSQATYESYRSRRDVLAAVYEQSEATLMANEEAMKQSGINLGETMLYAPFNGIVTTKYYDPGAMISTGMPVLAVQDPVDNWVDFKVKETELSKYKINQKVRIVGRNQSLQLEGTIVDISKKPNFATYRATSERKDAEDIITFNVKVQVNDERVRPGMRFKLQE